MLNTNIYHKFYSCCGSRNGCAYRGGVEKNMKNMKNMQSELEENVYISVDN